MAVRGANRGVVVDPGGLETVGLIRWPEQVAVYLCLESVDFRKGANSLALWVEQATTTVSLSVEPLDWLLDGYNLNLWHRHQRLHYVSVG